MFVGPRVSGGPLILDMYYVFRVIMRRTKFSFEPLKISCKQFIIILNLSSTTISEDYKVLLFFPIYLLLLLHQVVEHIEKKGFCTVFSLTESEEVETE